MASRRQRNKKSSNTSIGLSLFMLLVGFIVGVYLSPQIIKTLPQKILTRLGVEKTEPSPQRKTLINKPPSEKIEVEKKIYSLEIAIFKDIESALGLLDTLNTRGYPTNIQPTNDGEKILYKVRLGFWTSESEAERFARTFETKEEMKVKVVRLE